MATPPGRRRRSSAALTLALLLAGLLALAQPARPDHVAGATYTGTIMPSGTVGFQVSADGSQIQNFQANNVPCSPSGTQNANVTSIPINSSGSPHTFTHNDGMVSITNGSFSPGMADGLIEMAACTPVPLAFHATPVPEQLGPCRCDDASTFTKHQKQFFSVDDRQQFDRKRVGVVANFLKTTVTVKCKGVSPPDCQATVELQISKGDKDIAEIPKSERKTKCKANGCPPEFKRTFEWRLRTWTGALKKKGVKKIHGRFKIECSGKTIFIPFVIALTPTGRVSRADSDLGNPAGS